MRSERPGSWVHRRAEGAAAFQPTKKQAASEIKRTKGFAGSDGAHYAEEREGKRERSSEAEQSRGRKRMD